MAGGLLGTLVDTLSNWIIVVLLVAFMLVDFAVLPLKMDRMFKDQKEIQVFQICFLPFGAMYRLRLRRFANWCGKCGSMCVYGG